MKKIETLSLEVHFLFTEMSLYIRLIYTESPLDYT